MEARGPVLAAVDLSEISPFVVRAAHALSLRLGAPLLVLHCSEALTEEGDGDPLLPSLRAQVEEARRSAEAELGRVLDAAGLAGVGEVGSAVVAGDPQEAVPGEARSVGARLVVVGAPHPHWVRVTAAQKIVRHCAAPVLVVRRSPSAGYCRILVAVDFSGAAAEAWAVASALAGSGACLVACHAVEDGAPGDEARQRLEAWVRERPGTLETRFLVEAGAPQAALLRAAAREGADLLALGRPAHRGLAELLLGSLPERLSDHAPCVVLVAGGGGGWEEP